MKVAEPAACWVWVCALTRPSRARRPGSPTAGLQFHPWPAGVSSGARGCGRRPTPTPSPTRALWVARYWENPCPGRCCSPETETRPPGGSQVPAERRRHEACLRARSEFPLSWAWGRPDSSRQCEAFGTGRREREETVLGGPGAPAPAFSEPGPSEPQGGGGGVRGGAGGGGQ